MGLLVLFSLSYIASVAGHSALGLGNDENENYSSHLFGKSNFGDTKKNRQFNYGPKQEGKLCTQSKDIEFCRPDWEDEASCVSQAEEACDEEPLCFGVARNSARDL